MIGTYASAVVISVAALLLGRGICVLAGSDRPTWLGGAVGFAALMAVCQVAISLPRRAWTALAVVVVLCAASLWVGRRRHVGWPSPLEALVVTLAVGVFLSLPFLANDRVGLLGVSLLNDSRLHLLLAEGLRHTSLDTLGVAGSGYPRGPHAIAATFAQLLGSDVDKTLTGVLMAAPILTGLTALGFLVDLPRGRRYVVAVLAALPYLAAAWYIQSAFKEPIMALLLMGLVLAVQDGRREGFVRPLKIGVPIAVLLAGVLYDYSYPGLIWPLAILACWLAAELVLGGSWRRLPAIAAGVRRAAGPLGIALLVLVVVVAPDFGQLHAFWASNGGTAVGTYGGINTSALADLAGPLHSLEGLNIWLNGDFRFAPADAVRAGLLAGLALLVAVYALVASLERRELAWPAAILGLGLVYVYVKHTQSPYVAAKALIVPAPLLAVGAGGALMRWLERHRRLSYAWLATAALAVVYFIFAFESSYLVLANGFVDPQQHINELRSLRRLVHGQRTLVLFYDDFFQWELLGVPVTSPVVSGNTPTALKILLSADKRWSAGQPLDFDSVPASTLDEFSYVITTRTDAQSLPPPNFHLVGRSRSYEVWHRVGPTPPHLVLPEAGSYGAILNCRTALGQRLSHERGVAVVRFRPRYVKLTPLIPGASENATLSLPPGRWDLSLPFTSDQAVRVRGAGLDLFLPPNLDRVGEIWPVGTVTSTGAPLTLNFKMTDPGLISATSHFFAPGQLIAVADVPSRLMPLRASCGRFIDWYTLRS